MSNKETKGLKEIIINETDFDKELFLKYWNAPAGRTEYRYELDGLFYYFEHRLHKGERIFGKDFGMDEGVFEVRLTIRCKDDDGEYWQLFLD